MSAGVAGRSPTATILSPSTRTETFCPAAPDPSCPDGPHPAGAAGGPRPARLVELPVGDAAGPVWKQAAFVVVGLAGLVLGSDLFVGGATGIAEAAGVSDAVIGLTVVALGTSLPELATSIVAALRGESEIAVGNVVGSNLFNVLGILGVAALVRPLAAPGLEALDLAVLGAITLVLLPMMWSSRRLVRVEAALLIAGYVGYVGYLALQHG